MLTPQYSMIVIIIAIGRRLSNVCVYKSCKVPSLLDTHTGSEAETSTSQNAPNWSTQTKQAVIWTTWVAQVVNG